MADPPATPPSPGGGSGGAPSGEGGSAKALGTVSRIGSTVVKLVSALERVEAKLSAATEKLEARLRALEDRVLVLERDAHRLVNRASSEARERGAAAAIQHLAALSDRVTRLEAASGGKAAGRSPRRSASE